MTEVWEHSAQKGSGLLVLLAIADHADDNGTAYPGLERLARKTRLTVRNVQYLLATISKTPELEVQTGAGPHGTNLYRVRVGALSDAGGQEQPGVKTLHPRKPASRGGENQRAGFHPNRQEPAAEPSLFESELPEAIDTPAMRAAWALWEQHRRQKRKTLTALSRKLQLAKLAEMGPARAEAAIRHSITQGWEGIYEPKPGSTNAAPPQKITKASAL